MILLLVKIRSIFGQLTALIFWSRKGLRQRRAGNRKPSGSLLQAYYRDSA